MKETPKKEEARKLAALLAPLFLYGALLAVGAGCASGQGLNIRSVMPAGDDGRDRDNDNDGKEDAVDTDDDNDGVPDDRDESLMDHDNDGTPDDEDLDDDNDGVTDASDEKLFDHDNDGRPDAEDPDDDNDGTPDIEDGDDPQVKTDLDAAAPTKLERGANSFH